MYRHGGGGHAGAGTCQISNEEADVFLEGLKNELKEK